MARSMMSGIWTPGGSARLRPEKMRRVSSPVRNVFAEVLVLIDEPPFVGVAAPLDLWAIVEKGEVRG
jgi:hypothetical protein